MNTTNPSEAREIARRWWLDPQTDDVAEYDPQQPRHRVHDRFVLVQEVITRPTSTPPDAGDSAKLVSELENCAITLEQTWHHVNPRVMRDCMQDAARRARRAIEQHATPSSATSEAVLPSKA